jgi:PIN domain nuclease of toxin-antitoxin system
VILLDTHVLLWLYAFAWHNLPVPVRSRIDSERLALSPLVLLEIGCLHEIGRVRPAPQTILDELSTRLGLTVADVSSADIGRAALSLTWTRDPFDRLLAAHSIVSGLVLITKNETIRRNLPLAWWGE